LGKAATPHRHAHSQDPPELRVPVPVVKPVAPEEAVTAEAGAAAAVATVVPAGAAATVAVPPVIGEATPVPFWAMAICLNMAWVLLAVGLMEKVIPLPQWPLCLQ